MKSAWLRHLAGQRRTEADLQGDSGRHGCLRKRIENSDREEEFKRAGSWMKLLRSGRPLFNDEGRNGNCPEGPKQPPSAALFGPLSDPSASVKLPVSCSGKFFLSQEGKPLFPHRDLEVCRHFVPHCEMRPRSSIGSQGKNR